ncbi:ATPase associated with various cellular activities AAA_5 [Carnobacterium maltaromaticum LMA28]|uniref:ATPase associated with various cellular activities AAA_5 n=1 Tax=Carnobacterium maltaromaticum LMA28 TaxID=1234679 RepID=K8ECX0_CARML|nr:AAA family ATPase [Carnobacterium maltaromaticum]CCO09583.1 ATPase associated with various cellular activities AAA_5 [Carnobacterium maltaromaticum LMA28]
MNTISGRLNVDLVGILTPEAISDGEYDLKPVHVNRNGDLVFTIKYLSDFPSNVNEDVVAVQGYQSDLKSWGFEDNPSSDNSVREGKLIDFLDGQIIIFKPEKRKTSSGHYTVAKNIRLQKQNKDFDVNDKLMPIPVFKENDKFGVNINIQEFEKRLQENKLLGTTPAMSKEAEDYPECIIWEESEDVRYLYSGIVGQVNNYNGVKYELDLNKYCKYLLKDSWDSMEYVTDDIVFIPSEMLTEEGTAHLEKVDIDLEIKELKKSIAKSVSENTKLDTSDVEADTATIEDDEMKFLNRFKQVTRSSEFDLFFDEKDLYNFHTAMKIGSLVVLSGLSGTGKSKLVRAYAKALQLGQEQLNFVSVRPFWQDDSDLLGYADTINSIYRAGDSGLVDTLIEASKHKDKLYLVCFDEMNIAKVEHYFSQFLSVLEMDTEYRKINLYNDDLTSRFYNSERYPATVTIGTNIMFVGTVNLDESTHQFSDKVLDRANLISLKLLPFTEMVESNQDKIDNIPTPAISDKEYRSFKNNNSKLKLERNELEFLWELHNEIHEVNKNIGIGWRIINQFNQYLINIPEQNVLKREEAIDMQLVQRVLTKLRGSEEQLKNLIGTIDASGNLVDSKLIKLFENNNSISSFKLSKKVICQKAKEIGLHGYTI